MARKVSTPSTPTPPSSSSRRPLQISSPLPTSPGGAYFPNDRQQPRTPSGRGRKADEVDGLGYQGARGYDEFDLTASPTHAYLETFDTYHTSPDPSHTPISPSPSMSLDSPYGGAEKDPLDNVGGRFGANQYASNHYLAPSATPNRQPRSPSGGRSRSRSQKRRGCVPTNPTKRRWVFFGIPAALVIIAGIVVGVVVATSKKGGSSSSGGSGSGSGGSGSSTKGGTAASDAATYGVAGTGKNGTVVTTDTGVQFTYINWFGGSWAVDPQNPYAASGRAQSWSPSLLEKWVWGQHIVRGVNLGGWLVTEAFIVPGLYEEYQTTTPKAVDEYTLCQAMGADLATKMEDHYKTFITEQDFAQIAEAGLNWVRIPLGYWAVETNSDEPYLAQVSWTYFLKAIGWARKYGLRILLDFHALPGSQNGWNHSGKQGSVNWMHGVMGIANAERHLEQIRSLTEFISQPGIREVVPMISLVNEVLQVVGLDPLRAFYYQAYETIRSVTGYGAGNGPIILYHEGFQGVGVWNDFMHGADRVAIDQHPYMAFTDQTTGSPSTHVTQACSWGPATNVSQSVFGLTIGGEFSLAINDCGKWLDGVDSTPAFTTLGSCDTWEEWFDWSDDTKAGFLALAQAEMDSLQNWFFWTWTIGNSTEKGYATSPMWNYKLGWQNGWLPSDPRVAGGYCSQKAGQTGGTAFNGIFPGSATGSLSTASAAPTIDATQLATLSAWPPTSLGPNITGTMIANLPTFTRTGTPVTLTTAAHPANATMVGQGWANAQDTAGAWVKVNGCDYPDAYNATDLSVMPTAACTGSAGRKRDAAVFPGPTPAPRVA